MAKAIKISKAIKTADERAARCTRAHEMIMQRADTMAVLGVEDLVVFGFRRGALTGRWDASTTRDAANRLPLQTIFNIAAKIDASIGIDGIVRAWALELWAVATA